MATLAFKKYKVKINTVDKYGNSHLSSKAKIIIIESDIDDVFQSIYTRIITKIHKSLGKGSRWIIDSVIDDTISICKYDPLPGSRYIKLPKELSATRITSLSFSSR